MHYTLDANAARQADSAGQRINTTGQYVGKLTRAEVSQLIIDAEQRIDAAFADSPLAERPDTKAVEQWMIGKYLANWK